MAITETVSGNNAVAITGIATNGNDTIGVLGAGDSVGVRGEGQTSHGVVGTSDSQTGGAGVFGVNRNGTGVRGESEARFSAAVHGLHKGGTGWGVFGEADNGAGTGGKSKTWHGVHGETESATGGAGVRGEHKARGPGVSGHSKDGIGVQAESQTFEAVHAETHAALVAAIAAYTNNPQGTGAAVYAESRSKGPAGYFKGDVEVTGSLRVKGRRVIVGQQFGLIQAYSPDDEDFISNSITIAVPNVHITAEVAIAFVVNEDEDEHLVNVGIDQIVSNNVVETNLGKFVERSNVTSITFFATAWASFRGPVDHQLLVIGGSMGTDSFVEDCWYAAFDTRTGRVIELHRFVGPTQQRSEDEKLSALRASQVLHAAQEHADTETLRVIRVPSDRVIEDGVIYRIDPRTETMTKECEAPRTMREFVRRARARKAGRT